MLDGFSGYNQILVHLEDQEKTAFTTPWGTFMYAKMPFGLLNAGGTFQRAMDIAFSEEKDKFLVIYLDDNTIFSESDEQHLQHLEWVFLKCRKFGISLNPKKSKVTQEEGKLLGNISSKDGIKIDLRQQMQFRQKCVSDFGRLERSSIAGVQQNFQNGGKKCVQRNGDYLEN